MKTTSRQPKNETTMYATADKADKLFSQLRKFYRENFVSGESDDAFLVWVETMASRKVEMPSNV